MPKNKESFSGITEAMKWADVSLSDTWGDEYDDLDWPLRFELVDDLLESESSAADIKRNVGVGNLESYAKTLAVQSGNSGEIPLHESLARIANWVDYEAEVVEAAAENVDDSSIQNEAEKQADEMRDAADSLQSASEQAAETAAEIYNETHVPSTENPDPLVAGNCGGPEIVVQGNPTESNLFEGYSDQELGALHSDISRAIREGFVEGNERKLLADIEAEIERRGGHTSSVTTGNPTTEPELEAVTAGNPVSESDRWRVRVTTRSGEDNKIEAFSNGFPDKESAVSFANQALRASGTVSVTLTEVGGESKTIETGNPGELPGSVKIEETELGGTIMELVPDPVEEKIEEAAGSEISTDIPPEPTDWLFKQRFAHR